MEWGVINFSGRNGIINSRREIIRGFNNGKYPSNESSLESIIKFFGNKVMNDI